MAQQEGITVLSGDISNTLSNLDGNHTHKKKEKQNIPERNVPEREEKQNDFLKSWY